MGLRMLRQKERPLRSDRFQLGGGGAPPEPIKAVALIQPRLMIGLLLIAAGVVWAIARGLQFYGLTPVDLYNDLDQPPLLVALVGAWLCHRSRHP